MELNITIAEDDAPGLLGLLSPHFKVRVKTGTDLKTFLCEQLGVQRAYFDDRIQTIFLNSKPVDDVYTAVVEDGAVLALSAAMPGLVGATFRKGGRYSWMRKIISYEPEDADTRETNGWVTLKLFNLVMKELGPDFLERGVWIDGEHLKAFFKKQPPGLFQNTGQMTLDGRAVSPEGLQSMDLEKEVLFVKIQA
jgi:hypothetical protein